MSYPRVSERTRHPEKRRQLKKKWLGECVVCKADAGTPKDIVVIQVNNMRGCDVIANVCRGCPDEGAL